MKNHGGQKTGTFSSTERTLSAKFFIQPKIFFKIKWDQYNLGECKSKQNEIPLTLARTAVIKKETKKNNK